MQFSNWRFLCRLNLTTEDRKQSPHLFRTADLCKTLNEVVAQSRRAADFLAVIALAVLFYVSPDRLTWLSGRLIVLIARILLTALK
jgi:hypothetical protein